MSRDPTLSSQLATFLSHDPIIRRFITLLPNLGIGSRKTCLAVCQDQRSPKDAEYSLLQIRNMVSDLNIRQFEDTASEYDLGQMLDHIAQRPIYRSFVSMMVRNEILDIHAGAEEVIEEGFHKEFRASQIKREEEFRLSYQCLDNDNFHPAQYSIYYEITPWWSGFARNLCGRFASKLDRLPTLFPQVQRRKNMARDTCRELAVAGYTGDGRNWTQFRTLDLELHKMKTGQEIQGACEMRKAWKFNELKPRYYYTTGGRSYWKSRYMKKIAVELMESVDASRLELRNDPTLLSYQIEEDDWMCVWDMTSFTTQLSELKYFLYYIAKNLEEDQRVWGRPLEVLDYHEGIVKIKASNLILDFIRSEAEEAPFTVWRVAEELYGSMEEHIHHQQNAPMLGVHGDIGCSTAHHGFHATAGAKNPKSALSVGDDALAAMREDPRTRFIPHMQLIGTLQEEKADLLIPLEPHSNPQVTKFLKRRLTRHRDGLSLGLLFAFPSLADVFNVKDEYHTFMDLPKDKRIAKFAAQVAAFFWDCHAIGEAEEDEYTLIRQVLKASYRKLGLRYSGSLPGIKHPAFNDRVMLAIPPLEDFDPFYEDWAEALWDRCHERWALLPQTLGPTSLPLFNEGLEFITQESPLVNVLEDIGCLEKMRMQTEWVETTVTNRRVFRSFLSDHRRSYRCRFKAFCPSWYNDLIQNHLEYPYTNLGI